MEFLAHFFGSKAPPGAADRRERAMAIQRQLGAQALQATSGDALGLPDGFDLRFEIIVLFAARVLYAWRQEQVPQEALQALWEALFEGFDYSLRQRGHSDIRMSARMRKLFRHATGRRDAYITAWETRDHQALRRAVARNCLDGAPADDPRVDALLQRAEGMHADPAVILNQNST